MNQALSIFDFRENPVRVVLRDGEPWFVSADICRVLGIGNPSDVHRALDADEKMTLDNIEGHSGKRGGAQSYNIISESGLYALIFKSRKPQAKAFRKWITAEVIPAIRKTGRYALPETQAPVSAQDAPAALPSPTVTILEYCSAAVTGWTLAGTAEFGRLAQRLAPGLGWRLTRNPEGWQVFPSPLLDRLRTEYESAQEHAPNTQARALLIAKATELDGDAEITARDLAGGESLDDLRALGRRLQPWRGRALWDRRGRRFKMTYRRTKSGALYAFRFF